jgi:antitoxin MazE
MRVKTLGTVFDSCVPIGYTVYDVYLWKVAMQVSKWGNSLAVRLPATVVEALELKEGDQIEIRIAGSREFEVNRDRSREVAIERLRGLRRPLPSGFTFDRAAANER